MTVFAPDSRNLLPNAIAPIVVTDGALVEGQNILLVTGTPPPPGTAITPATFSGGIPVINWGLPFTLIHHDCVGGTATYTITGVPPAGILASGQMVESPPGTYTAIVPPLWPYHGLLDVKITVICPENITHITEFDAYSDPSGTVTTPDGSPVSGATVSLFRSDSASGPFTQVPNGSGIMSLSNRNNPDTTNAAGQFGWDVIAGFYKVRAQKAGCSSPTNPLQVFVETGVMQIPPPVTGLQLVLKCGGPSLFIYLPAILR